MLQVNPLSSTLKEATLSQNPKASWLGRIVSWMKGMFSKAYEYFKHFFKFDEVGETISTGSTPDSSRLPSPGRTGERLEEIQRSMTLHDDLTTRLEQESFPEEEENDSHTDSLVTITPFVETLDKDEAQDLINGSTL